MTRHEQRAAALERSWRVKEQRRRARLALAHRRITLRSALRLACVQRMTLASVLVWQPWWGRVRAGKALNTLARAGVSPTTRIGELTAKQRLLVVMVCLSHEPQRLQRAAA